MRLHGEGKYQKMDDTKIGIKLDNLQEMKRSLDERHI